MDKIIDCKKYPNSYGCNNKNKDIKLKDKILDTFYGLIDLFQNNNTEKETTHININIDIEETKENKKNN